MATQASSHTAHQPGLGRILWGAASALAAVVVVMTIAAGWISVRGQYPDHAQHLALPLTELNTASGKVEQIKDGAQLVPDERGVAIVLFDAAPRFPAIQFSRITLELLEAASVDGAEVLWATRKAPDETHSLPLDRDGATLTATLAESRAWTDRVNGIGIALRTQSPVDLESVTLHPPDPTFGYVMTRMWREWTYREEYHGSTINGIRGAGPATLLPRALAGGLALLIAIAAIWITQRLRHAEYPFPKHAFFSAITVLWILNCAPWINAMVSEAHSAIHDYYGKTDREKRLSEPDAHLYRIAERVKDQLPEPPQLIQIAGGGENPPRTRDFARSKLRYYLLPHNVLGRWRELYPSGHTRATPVGAYVLVIDRGSDLWSVDQNGRTVRGYKIQVISIDENFRLFKIAGKI